MSTKDTIEAAWEGRGALTPANAPRGLRAAVDEVIAGLDAGRLRVAEKAGSGKALGGGLVQQDGRLNFVIVVLSGDSLKEVMLEPPKAGRRGSDKYRLNQP